jgi:hypothetical protein
LIANGATHNELLSGDLFEPKLVITQVRHTLDLATIEPYAEAINLGPEVFQTQPTRSTELIIDPYRRNLADPHADIR